MSLLSFVSRASLLSVVLAVVAAVPASAAKVIVFPPTAGAGLTKQEAVVVADAVAAATSRAGHDVVTQQQLAAVIGLESMKQLAGCEASSCLSELSDALGAEAIVNVSVGTVGQSVIVTLKRSDTKGGANKVGDRRFKKGKGAIEGILDALPALVAEVLGGLATTTTTATAPATTTTAIEPIGTTTVVTKGKVSPARLDEVIATPKGLTWVHDGHGRVLAFSTTDPQKAPIYAGTSTSMYEIHNGSGFSSDGDGGFSRGFWDPRIGGGGAQRSFERRKGVYTQHLGSGRDHRGWPRPHDQVGADGGRDRRGRDAHAADGARPVGQRGDALHRGQTVGRGPAGHALRCSACKALTSKR